MFISAKSIKNYKLVGLDEDIGKVEEFYFDDKHWVIRYVVANTGNWLMGKQVLISPYSVTKILQPLEKIEVNLTKNKIESSPSIDTDRPVSRQFENTYYGFPRYWTGSFIWGMYPALERDPLMWEDFTEGQESWDPQLRSTDEVKGYHIEATDGEIGHVEDFIIDTEAWALRYLVVSTHNWWPGRKS